MKHLDQHDSRKAHVGWLGAFTHIGWLGAFAHIGWLGAFTLACAIVLPAGSAMALPVSASGGFDYYSGPNHQITRSVIGLASAGLGGAGVTVGGLRYDDNQIGEGTGWIAGLKLPVLPLASLALTGYRYVGDETFRAWRVKAGPRIGIPGGGNLGLYYTHFEDNTDAKSDGAIGELGVPLVAGFSGRVTAAYAKVPGDLKSTQGSVGLSWGPMRNLEFSGDIGLAHNGAITTAPIPSRGPFGLPLVPGGSTTSEENKTESTYSLGVRVTFP